MYKAVELPLLGHPDKVCDVLVESVVDEYLRRDPMASLDIQALGTGGMVMIGGMVVSRADFAVIDTAREAYKSIGYTDTPDFFVNIERPRGEKQSATSETGAQGTAIVYGYATNQTREMLPPAVVFARAFTERIETLRATDARFSWMLPDGKVQVVTDADKVTHVTLIVAHTEGMDQPHVQGLLLSHVVQPVLHGREDVQVFINPVGNFTTVGFSLNAGVSGRKVLSDLYGGLLPHGGVSFVGKDPLKPARCGTYMARYAARQLVRDGVGAQILVQVVYTAGVAAPLLVQAYTGEGKDVSQIAKERFDFRPEAIVERLHLRRPCYADCVRGGTVGNPACSWEQ